MESEQEILIPFNLEFSDLLLLSNPSSSLSSKETALSIESISYSIMQALGPSGPGLLSVSGVPHSVQLRSLLLPLARKLSILENKDRVRILKEHGLGSDVPLKNPDRNVSSFAMKLKHQPDLQPEFTSHILGNVEEILSKTEGDTSSLSRDLEFEHLGITFKKLGHIMMELGLRLAKICDIYIGNTTLEKSIIDSRTAKGRLIHYHSVTDNIIIKEANKKTKGNTRRGDLMTSTLSDLWQQWHYDYGIFTVLTDPLFISSNGQQFSSPDGHTYLQLFDPTKNRIYRVKPLPGSFIIQAGEAADILSNGRLRSTLHSVCRPAHIENLSRETFVVFLQPAWTETLPYPKQLLNAETSQEELTSTDEESSNKTQQSVQTIFRHIPPLSSRLKDGMTFADFSRETTKQYYGVSGTQSRAKQIFQRHTAEKRD